MSEQYFYPEELDVAIRYNTRLWLGSEADRARDQKGIEELARQIEAVGQIETAVAVLPAQAGYPHILVVGHRRRHAVALINQRRTAEAKARGVSPLLSKLRVRVAHLEDPFQTAVISNLSSCSYSPMDLAAVVCQLRAQFGRGKEETAKIAEYLTIPVASVRQYEKLIREADAATQAALHAGKLPLGMSFEMLDALEAKRDAVVAVAAKLQEDAVEPSINDPGIFRKIKAKSRSKSYRAKATRKYRLRKKWMAFHKTFCKPGHSHHACLYCKIPVQARKPYVKREDPQQAGA
jgi:hypothetical protein